MTRRSDIKLTRSRIPQASLRAAADNFCSSLQNKLKFNLLPALYLSPVYRGWFPTRQPFWGIVASATLLSVGAPFWFNMLRTYSNLRSILTNKEDKKCKETICRLFHATEHPPCRSRLGHPADAHPNRYRMSRGRTNNHSTVRHSPTPARPR